MNENEYYEQKGIKFTAYESLILLFWLYLYIWVVFVWYLSGICLFVFRNSRVIVN